MKNSRLLCQKVKPELWRIRRRQSVRGSRHDFEMSQIRRFATTPPETRSTHHIPAQQSIPTALHHIAPALGVQPNASLFRPKKTTLFPRFPGI
jgi:hypothetical protein